MNSKSHYGSNNNNRFYYVCGLSNGREVFLGRAIDENTDNGTITIEGKSISCTNQGTFSVRPFTTTCTFQTNGTTFQIQQITNTDASNEAAGIYNLAIGTINRTNYPLTCRWIDSATSSNGQWTNNGWTNNGRNTNGNNNGSNANNPFTSFYTGFRTSCEQFRRAIFQSTNVTTTRELDRLIELESSMTTEIGRTINKIAIQFNSTIGKNGDLSSYMDSIYGYGSGFGQGFGSTSTNTLYGWSFLMSRLNTAKSWARRNGKTQIVRDVNEMTKQAIHDLNEIILENCGTLDTLITETFTQYGMNFEIYGDISPFTNCIGGNSNSGDAYETATNGNYATAAA